MGDLHFRPLIRLYSFRAANSSTRGWLSSPSCTYVSACPRQGPHACKCAVRAGGRVGESARASCVRAHSGMGVCTRARECMRVCGRAAALHMRVQALTGVHGMPRAPREGLWAYMCIRHFCSETTSNPYDSPACACVRVCARVHMHPCVRARVATMH